MTKYKDYSFRELQVAVKKRGLTADGNRDELIAKLEGKPVKKTPDLNDRMDRMEAMIAAMVRSKNKEVVEEVAKPVDIIEEDFEEDFEKEKPDPIEPKVFQAGADERVTESHVTGGAPDGMLLNDFLKQKGISFNELNNILKTYISKIDTNDTVRITTIDDVERQIREGMDRAKEIEKSDKDRVEITKDIHLVDALKQLGWQAVGIRGRAHILERR